MRADYDIIGEPAVYPGHPITLAYLIVRLYSSLEAARAHGKTFSAVEEDIRLPGAGSHNSYAVGLLSNLAADYSWDAMMVQFDDLWARVDSQKDDGWGDWARERPGHYRSRWKRGQDQADRIKPLLREALKTWPLKEKEIQT